jgi:hypothetical protein
MVSLRQEQGVAVVPGLVLKATSLYGASGTVHTRKNPRRVQEGDQDDVILYWLPGPNDGEIGPCQQPVRSATGLS